MASFSQGLASCYRLLGAIDKALDTLSRLIALTGHFPASKTWALIERGLLYEELGRYELGAIDYAEAAKIAAAAGDRKEEFVAMNNSAASLLKRGLAREG